MINRRELMIGLGALIGSGWIHDAQAMGRVPLGGELSFQLPHDTSQLNPFDLFDPLAALVGSAVFDSVYRLDGSSNPYPSLADAMPEAKESSTRIRLRKGLRSGRGRTLNALDLIESIERSRRLGGTAILLGVPKGRIDPQDSRVARFRDTEPIALARALASPIVPLVSRRSTVTRPDGTGAFVARPSRDQLLLERNTNAARGAANLQRIRITRAGDLVASLRAFEARRVDLGWLGAGLHQPRSGSIAFDLGSVGWIVLRTGREARAWGAPGLAQRLLNAIPPSRLAHLALGRLPHSSTALTWGGGACKLIVPSRSAHLIQVGKTLASILSRPGHEIELQPVAQGEFMARRASRSFALMVDVVRPIGPPGIATLVALATADDRARARSIARRPPKLESYDPRVLSRTLRLGVVGSLQVAGAAVSTVKLLPAAVGAGWDLGASYQQR